MKKPKINSAFTSLCPTCKQRIPYSFNKPDEAWKCIACETLICVWCYSNHTAAEHPELYARPSEPSEHSAGDYRRVGSHYEIVALPFSGVSK